MKIGFRLLPKGIEEGAFKPVPEGWLLKTANPFCFGPSRTYLVTDAQKPAVAAGVRRSRYVSVIGAVIAVEAIGAAVALQPWLRSATPKTIIVWSALFAVTCLLLPMIDYLMMRPVVRDLPRTAQKVRMIDVWKRLSGTMSTYTIVFFTIFSVFAGATNLYLAVFEKNVLAWVGGPFMLFLAVFYATMLVAKLRAKSTVSKG